MPTFRVRMQGTHTCWPSDWVIDRDIKLLKCTFTRISLDQNQNLSIDVEVDAPSEEEATELGIDIISKEFDLFALCVENWLQLDEYHVWTEGV